jgi:drug/metabolite transporter (DMT)-like permease
VSEPAAAVVTALASALVLGISAVADQRSTKQVQTRRALSPRIIVDLVHQPLWLIAVGANLVGFALQVVALAFGSLALVQPIVATDLMFSVLIGRYLWRRPSVKPSNIKLMGSWPPRSASPDSSPSGSRRAAARRLPRASCLRWPSGSS